MRPVVMLGWPDRALDATITGGSWAAGYGAASMQDERVTEVARSSNLLLASTQVALDLGAARTIRLISAHNHNAPQAGLWRIRAGSAQGLPVAGLTHATLTSARQISCPARRIRCANSSRARPPPHSRAQAISSSSSRAGLR